MLSKELKNRTLHDSEEERKERAKTVALSVLDLHAKHLIATIKCAELDGTLTREESEAYVIKRLESYERFFYSIDDEMFDDWINDELTEAIMREEEFI